MIIPLAHFSAGGRHEVGSKESWLRKVPTTHFGRDGGACGDVGREQTGRLSGASSIAQVGSAALQTVLPGEPLVHTACRSHGM